MERGVENRVDRPPVQSQFGTEISSIPAISMTDSAESSNFISDDIKEDRTWGISEQDQSGRYGYVPVSEVYRNRLTYAW